jgi:hypothetical protein
MNAQHYRAAHWIREGVFDEKGGLQFVGDGFFNVVDLHSHKSVDQLFGVEAGRAPLDPQDGR